MTARSATGAHLPSAAESLRRKGGAPPPPLDRLRRVAEITGKVKADLPQITNLFKCLVFLPDLDIKGFVGAAWAGLEQLEPAEPGDKLFAARFDAAKATWEALQAKAEPTGQDFDKCLELIAAAAIATQEDEGPPPKPEAAPPATVAAAYAARKPAPTKPTKPAARVVMSRDPFSEAGAKGIYSARRNLSK